MKKTVLKKALINVFKKEEAAVGIYTDIIASLLPRFLEKKSLSDAKDIVQVMIRYGQHHKNTSQNILSHIELDPKNDL